MAETLLNHILTPEFNIESFIQWLTNTDLEDPQTTLYKCTRSEFITFFLNIIHEDIGSTIVERKNDEEETKSSSDMNRSLSYPLDLSSETEGNVSGASYGSGTVANSTPKITKVNSDSSVLSYLSPVSPIYKQSSFTTPKGLNKSLCLGDFIVNKRVSTKKKSDSKRRIKPTNLSQQRVNNSFYKSENSFNFKNELEEFPSGRDLLLEERLKVTSWNTQSVIGGSRKNTKMSFGEIQPELHLVTHRREIDRLVSVYCVLLEHCYVLNLTSEIYFLMSLLIKKQFYDVDWGVEVLNDKITINVLFNSIHNIVYFAGKCLERQLNILRNYDNSTLRLLLENERLKEFSLTLIQNLQKITKPDRIIKTEPSRNNICFNSDTDNRQNFPNDLSFHAFKKQRDLFYEILRIWEQHHLSPGFNYLLSLGGKIKTLLSLSTEPTNFIHFARLFKAQLLNACPNSENDDFMTSLDVDAQKLSKLRNRCVTKENSQGLNSLPVFNEGEEFYKDFILVGANYVFNRHLADAFIEEINELNESWFSNSELEQDEEENSVDVVTKKSYYSCIKSLRILAKFLGFIESLPYKSESASYSEQLLTTHLKIRKQICPNFDIKTLLETSIRRKSIILCVPWLIKYLSMLDYVTLKLPYYTLIHSTLFWIYRNFDWAPEPNIYLVKFCLGWLFELPHIPNNDYLYFCTEPRSEADDTQNNLNTKTFIDQLEIVDQDILYVCCPYLDEIKKLLSATSTQHSISIKHITPVSASQSPAEMAKRKIEQQLEEAFFNGQPVSIRKTVEFVSERVASACVKYICVVLVPEYKKTALEKFRSEVRNEDDQIVLKTKASHLAGTCLGELREACEREVEKMCAPKIRSAVEALLSFDILAQTREVCLGITKKMCLERVRQWLQSHMTSAIFTKDFNDEIQKMTNSEIKKLKKPLFILPPGGLNPRHNNDTLSGAHLIEKFRVLTIDVIERKPDTEKRIIPLLDETSRSIVERGDLNQCIISTLCTQILDLFLLFLARDTRISLQDDTLSKTCDIWRMYHSGCDDLFKSLLCPRNIRILGQSKTTWDAFAEFCAYLIEHKLLSCDNFESQCTGIFRTNWNQETLKLITDFFKTFHSLYRDRGGSASDFTFLLDFFSDYCEDLF